MKFRRVIVTCRTVVVCLLLLAINCAKAQEGEVVRLPDIKVHNYSCLSTDNGLSSNTVNVIYRDQTGLMWIGTEDGLNSYDGYTISRYLPDESDSTSIPGKQIFEIAELDPNVVTIALGDGGIGSYDKRTRKFYKDLFGKHVSNEDRECAFGLIRVGNSLYVIYPEYMVRYDLKTKVVSRIELPKKMPKTGVKWGRIKMKIMPGEGDNMAMLTGTKSLSLMNMKDGSIVERQFSRVFLYDICPLDANRLFVAASDGIYIYDFSTNEFTQQEFLKGESVSVVRRSVEGDFWVWYGGNKLTKWSPQRNTRTDVANSESFTNSRTKVNDIYEDENGLLWVATSNNGVLKIDTKTPKISTIFIENDLPRDYTVSDLSAASSKEIWAACGTTGFVRIDMESRTSRIIPAPHLNVSCVKTRKNGTVLVGTTKGLFSYDVERDRLKSMWIREYVADSIGRVMIRDISEDCLGNVWLATNIGVYKYNGVDFKRIEVDDMRLCVINCLYEDSDGRIWAGSCSGAYVKNLNDTIFQSVGKRWTGRNDEGVQCIAEQGKHILMGSSDGVIVYDKETCQNVAAKAVKDFEKEMIYSMVCDKNDVLWLSTSSGIGYVDVYYGNVYRFDRSDGLYYEGNECRTLTMADDMIYFGQVSAINAINTQRISFNTRMPKTYVSDVVYGKSGYRKEMSMADDTTYVAKYELNASARIHVASSDYTNTQRNLFMYKLDQGDWILLSNSNEIVMSGIFPGKYHLKLRSSNADKTWSYDIKSICIDILSPMWLSQPAIIFYAILGMGLVWILLKMRYRSITRRVRLAEAEAKSKGIVEDQRNKLARIIGEQYSSFNYAKRIQDALMPRVEDFQKYFAKLFVLYRPRDVVSGDFYTFYRRDGLTFVISADCTGHGVPGAFISILGIDHLNNIIMKQKVDDAGEILTRLHSELHDAVIKMSSSEEFNDGMDITVCVVNHDERTVNFAGAMNDLYIIRNNEVVVYHGERNSIGTNMSVSTDGMLMRFHSQDIECMSGDMLYLFSDGFKDQFGGPENKKFKERRFKNLLLNVHKLPAADQKILLNQKLVEWSGAIEQTDDISIIGFEPWA